MIDVAEGLWLGRMSHLDWEPGHGWDPPVTSVCVESGGEVAVLDAIAPPDDQAEVWQRLDARPPTLAVVLKPDHVRDVDRFVERYGARPIGPKVFHRGDIPDTVLEWLRPGDVLPGGLVALYDGRDENETPLWPPQQRALVFADALAAPRGELCIWWTPRHRSGSYPPCARCWTCRSST